MARMKDANWLVKQKANGDYAVETAQLAVLMDIRDELKQLNRVFAWHNFQEVPSILRKIRANTAKPRKPKEQP